MWVGWGLLGAVRVGGGSGSGSGFGERRKGEKWWNGKGRGDDREE
jgi:hypothetical protein